MLECIGLVAYHLKLPTNAKIPDVFHVTFFKKFQGDPPTEEVALPPIHHGRVLQEPAMIRHARLNQATWELLVQWKGFAASDAPWMLLPLFREKYPDFQLEDELFLKEGRCCGLFCLQDVSTEAMNSRPAARQ